MSNLALSALHKNIETPDTQSLSGWANAYLTLIVNGSSPATLKAKERDLRLFLQFAVSFGINDRVQYWTPALSKSFQTEMLSIYSFATVARMMATLSHFAGWLKGRVWGLGSNGTENRFKGIVTAKFI